MALEDDELAALAASGGDAAAFGELVRRHQGVVRGFLRRLTGDHAEADDLAQDAFIKAFGKIAAYRGPGRLRSWFLSIAYREFLMARRRSKSWGRVFDVLARDQKSADDAELLSTERSHGSAVEAAMDVERYLEILKGPEKEAILLCDAYGFSHSEAAQMMKAPLGTVKSHVLRGRQKLRAAMDGQEEEAARAAASE